MPQVNSNKKIAFPITNLEYVCLNMYSRFGFLKLPNFKLNAQSVVKDRYSISESSKQTYSEEIVIEIPAYTKLRVFFQWKRIWQLGLIRFQDRNNKEFEIPFRVALGITFDQMQVDEK